MSRDTSKLDLGYQSVLGVSGRALLLISGLIEVLVLTRFLPPSGVGRFYLFISAGEVLAQVISGVGVAIQKRTSEADTSRSEYLGTGLSLTVVYGSVLIALLSILPTRFVLFDLELTGAAVWSVFYVVMSNGIFKIANDVYSGTGYPGEAVVANGGRTLFRVLVIVPLLFVGSKPSQLVLGVASANTLIAAVILVRADVIPALPSRTTLRRSFEFAKYSVPNAFFQRMYSRVDLLLLGVLAGGAAASFYEVALRLTIPAATIPAVLGRTLTVKASGLNSRNVDGVDRELARTLRYAGVLGFPLIVGAVVIGDQLLAVMYTAEYVQAWPALVGLSVFQLVSGYRLQYTKVADGINEPETNLRINVLSVVVFVPIAVPLVAAYGLVGIVVATTLGEAIRLLLYRITLDRVRRVSIVTRDVVGQALVSIVMGLIVYAVSQIGFGLSETVSTVILVAIGAVSYALGLVVVSDEIRTAVRRYSGFELKIPYDQ